MKHKYFLYQWWIRENKTLYCLGVQVDPQDTRDVADQIILQSPVDVMPIVELQAYLANEPNRVKGEVVVREFASLEAIQWAISHGA